MFANTVKRVGYEIKGKIEQAVRSVTEAQLNCPSNKSDSWSNLVDEAHRNINLARTWMNPSSTCKAEEEPLPKTTRLTRVGLQTS